MKYIFFLLALVKIAFADSNIYYLNEGEKIILTPIKNINRSLNQQNIDADFYKTKNNIILGVNNIILVKFKNTKNLNKYIKQYDLEIIEEILPNLYKVSVKNKTKTLNIANDLTLKKDISYAQPDFIKQRLNR